jgi:hypothetical protein
MDQTAFLIYSHTDNVDIWRASLTQVTEKIPNQSSIYFAINDASIFNSTLIDDFPDVIVVTYQDDLPFCTKLLNVIDSIPYTHILLFLDFHLLMNADIGKLSSIIKTMMNLSIDCVQLWCNKTLPGIGTIRPIDKTYYPFSVQPCIWNKISLVQLLTNFKTIEYRDLEKTVWHYTLNNFNIYSTVSAGRTIRTNHCDMDELFTYGRVMGHRHWCKIYEIYHTEFEKKYNCVIDRYNLKETALYKKADEAIKKCKWPECIKYAFSQSKMLSTSK